ncbi:FRG domain-containing protein [Caulobacter sp. BK020]|uniref:FRG domain-containing protein n=1 Tax=Caulobacter sp. BK020 TaxID=2512117 RepID=UPI0010498C5C|nr:FRG domain-containing protein [Caulobacter sp. BK020]TCS17539.1 FRG domain-containing protein [Caulobacter sp. BK020]
MADKLDIIKPTSFAELLDAIETFQAGSSVSWYRGCRKSSHGLKPSIYRHPNITKIADVISLEGEVTTRFVQRSLPFLSRSLTSDWDKLFLMQHYGVPTRLLDWSENPFVAIYFALNAALEPKATSAALWMCDPVAWNRAALAHISFRGGVLDETSPSLRAYAPGTKVDEIPMLPIMIYGSYNSARIVAQRGGFALFGQGTTPMEEVFRADQFPVETLRKIEIGHEYVDDIRNSLFRKGFTESVVFPDLDGLSKEIRRVFGF